MDIDYADGLTLTSIAKGPVVTSGTFVSNLQDNRISWVNPTNVTNDGILMTLTFAVGDFSVGTKSVSVKLTNDLPTNLCDEGESPIAVNFVPGGVIIPGPGGGPEGAIITDTLQSYNPNNPVTIELKQGEDVKYTKTIEGKTGSGQAEQEFTFEGVLPGIYTLVITKELHFTLTVMNIVVDDDDVDLTQDDRDAVKLMTLVAGNVFDEENDSIDALDVFFVMDNMYKSPKAEDVPASADVNGDDVIDAFDVYIIMNNLFKINDSVIW